MKILIAGAGIAGLTLAYCLERHGHHPVVVEKLPGLRDAGYMIDFSGPATTWPRSWACCPSSKRSTPTSRV
ncbi:MAG TPA: NAD(P)-binding protein [Chloroflexota bacterium]|nr:NAD(P)-binding protein [Chloroflexota bacterium]